VELAAARKQAPRNESFTMVANYCNSTIDMATIHGCEGIVGRNRKPRPCEHEVLHCPGRMPATRLADASFFRCTKTDIDQRPLQPDPFYRCDLAWVNQHALAFPH
jgi:hypothetical protein